MLLPDINGNGEIHKIYFVGIKGVGMTSLALIAKDAGFEVAGSDVSEEFLTDSILEKAKIPVDTGFDPKKIEEFTGGNYRETLVITTAAHDGLGNPQSEYALGNKIPILTHGQAVGYFMQGELFGKKFDGISVLGCHGKTTITAMTATALDYIGLEPSYSAGTSQLFPLGNPGHLGSGPYFVAEADEFISDVKKDRTVKFLYQNPKYVIVNNIDFDHPDVFKDLEEVKETFFKFLNENVGEGGYAILNGDDKSLKEFKSKVLTVIMYGEGKDNEVRISNFHENGWGSRFDVQYKGKELGTFSISVPGYYNAKNSLSVITLLLALGIEIDKIKEAIGAFLGTKRRQERVGITQNGAIVIDDYAHHPDEVDKTLSAVKTAYPNRKIVCLFQPHTLSRTVALAEEFTQAFTHADSVVFLPIFTSKREGEVHYEDLYAKIKNGILEKGKDVVFLKDNRKPEQLSSSPYFFQENRTSVVEYLMECFNSKDFVLTFLGAGDLYRIAYDLVER